MKARTVSDARCIAQIINIARKSKEVKTRAWQRRRGQGWAILFSRLRLSPARPAYHCDEADEEGEETFFVENIRWIKVGKRECKALWCNRWSGTIRLKNKVPMVRPFNLFAHNNTKFDSIFRDGVSRHWDNLEDKPWASADKHHHPNTHPY